jgi:RNA polymerase sigma factor (sigma-70 family)
MHLAFNWRRDRKRRRDGGVPTSDPPAAQPSPLVRLADSEEAQRVLDALAELPEAARTLLVMRYIEDQPYERIAAHLGRSVHQARARCQKALRRLRRAMGEEVRHAER